MDRHFKELDIGPGFCLFGDAIYTVSHECFHYWKHNKKCGPEKVKKNLHLKFCAKMSTCIFSHCTKYNKRIRAFDTFISADALTLSSHPLPGEM